jgi:predicted AAA+ superfamily ATPase
LTLDDAGVLSAASSDPAGFLAGLQGNVVLDEVQRAPALFLAIKREVDRQRQPGRFLLTGSANVLLLPHLAESLAGRMEILTLWPLSQGELANSTEGFIDALFGEPSAERLHDFAAPDNRAALLGRIVRGGYPEVVLRTETARRAAWFGSYITTILQRDVRDLAHIEGLTSLPRLLALLAARSASILNQTELSRSLGMPASTLKRYLGLLETTFLVQTLPAWSGNLSKRLVRAPKVTLNDTGLMAYLLGAGEERLAAEPDLVGPLLETFVIAEVRKQLSWSKTRASLYYLRTQSGQEVDLVLEDAGGQLVGIEVKSSSTISAHDFAGLRLLANDLGPRFRRGVVLYSGVEAIPFASNLHAWPLSALCGLAVCPPEPGLPDKTEVVAYCPLSKKQAVLYQQAVDALAAQVAMSSQ